MKTPFLNLMFFMLLFLTDLVNAADPQLIKIAYITQELKRPAALSNLDEFVQQKGRVGAEIAIADNNTTGQFTGQQYQLLKIIAAADDNVEQLFKQQVTDDIDFVISNLSGEQLKIITELDQAKDKLFFDATTSDDGLRNENCIKNVLHMLPSRAMRADALAQYMLKKKWTKWFLVSGMTEEDKDYSQAIKRSVKRFGMKLVAEKKWTHTYDARRTAQSDVPVFTQGVDYDVLVVADEQGLFGEYLEYRSWIPRPVIGTQGLVPTSWHRTHEQWGAVQVQRRFKKLAGRYMDEQDYGAYLAVRAIGEATVRSKAKEVDAVKQYLFSKDFALQGYKGKPLSFRSWNGQLRQPVLLAAARSLVSVAPVEGFLHPKTELDTLGFDESESSCMKPGQQKKPVFESENVEKKAPQSKIDKLIQKIKYKIKQLQL